MIHLKSISKQLCGNVKAKCLLKRTMMHKFNNVKLKGFYRYNVASREDFAGKPAPPPPRLKSSCNNIADATGRSQVT